MSDDNELIVIEDTIAGGGIDSQYLFNAFNPDAARYIKSYQVFPYNDEVSTLSVYERVNLEDENHIVKSNSRIGTYIGYAEDVDLQFMRSDIRVSNFEQDKAGYSQVRSYTNTNGATGDDGRLDSPSIVSQIIEWTPLEEVGTEVAEIFGTQLQSDSFRIQHHIENRDYDNSDNNTLSSVTPFEVKTSGGTDPSAVTFETTIKHVVDPVDPRDAATKHYVDQHRPTGITNGNASIFVDDQGSVRMQAANTEGQPTASFFLTEHGAGGFNVNGSFFANGNREASFGGGGHTFTLDERGYTFRHNREEVTFTFDEIKRLKDLIG